MKIITINIWGPHVKDADTRLKTHGIQSAKYVTPWRVPLMSVQGKDPWAIQVDYDPGARDEIEVPLHVGWILGLLCIPKGAEIDYEVKDMTIELKV